MAHEDESQFELMVSVFAAGIIKRNNKDARDVDAIFRTMKFDFKNAFEKELKDTGNVILNENEIEVQKKLLDEIDIISRVYDRIIDEILWKNFYDMMDKIDERNHSHRQNLLRIGGYIVDEDDL